MRNGKKRPLLFVIEGGLQKRMKWGNVTITAAPAGSQPHRVAARVYEEDTFLVMSQEPEYATEPAHPLRLMAELSDLEPELPGTILLQGRYPIKIFAVIYDVDSTPICRPEWVAEALKAIFEAAMEHNIRAMAIPLLGCTYGPMTPAHFTEILADTLIKQGNKTPMKIWIMAEVGENKKIIEILEQRLF